MTSSVDSHKWEAEYVDLRSRFISDVESEALRYRYPSLPLSPDLGCPTCEGTRVFVFQGESQDCDCELQLQLHKHYLVANIGLLYQRLGWDDYQGDEKAKGLVELYLNNHEKMIRTGMGLIFFGKYGTGKTFLASLVAKELVKLGYNVFFSTFAEMIDMFTKGWGNNDQRARFESKIVESGVFILDDVGKEFRTKTNLAESTFDHVLRQRAVDARPTFITTNMDAADLDQGYGGAIFSLLKERSVLHAQQGEDFRAKARERTLEEVLKSEHRPIW